MAKPVKAAKAIKESRMAKAIKEGREAKAVRAAKEVKEARTVRVPVEELEKGQPIAAEDIRQASRPVE